MSADNTGNAAPNALAAAAPKGDDLKRYFIETCCERGKKPTGTSGPAKALRDAQRIYSIILTRNAQASFGGSGSDSDTSSDSDDSVKMEDGAEVANLGPPATAPAGPAMARQDTGGAVDCTVKKRKRHSEGGDSKSKNSRPTNPRSSAT
ncbi:hypothetical protein B484DRAFT_404595 [Ochromonadaceae sp. CCMP2298]|nr:hypothetical protein B484DRAFT_404595 [Ochromonadaceae sp. CCMP2298]